MTDPADLPSAAHSDKKAPKTTNYQSMRKGPQKDTPPKGPERPGMDKLEVGATVRKKPLGKRIAETMTGDDARTVGDYVLFDVVIPAVKNLFFDAASQGLERTLFGTVRRQGSGPSNISKYHAKPNTRSPLGRAFEPDGPTRTMSQTARANHDFDGIVLEDAIEADRVLEALKAYIEQYNIASVSDLYDAVGVTGSFQDEKWGWFPDDVRHFGKQRVRNGYLLNLPRPSSIE